MERADEARTALADGPIVFAEGPVSEPCSTCGSGELVLIRRGRRVTFLTWLLLGMPLWRQRSIWRCAGCGETQRQASEHHSEHVP